MVHQYQLNGYNIVLDTCSGSVHVVDDVAYDVIAMYPEHTADEIVAAMMAKYGDREDVTEADLRQCIDDVASLKESGKLDEKFARRYGVISMASGIFSIALGVAALLIGGLRGAAVLGAAILVPLIAFRVSYVRSVRR